MKKTAVSAIVLAALLGAGTAFADGADYNEQNRAPAVGALSRAEVQTQLAQAARRGELLAAGEALGNEGVTTLVSSRDRASVRAEAVAAARAATQNPDVDSAFFASRLPAGFEGAKSPRLGAARQADNRS